MYCIEYYWGRYVYVVMFLKVWSLRECDRLIFEIFKSKVEGGVYKYLNLKKK